MHNDYCQKIFANGQIKSYNDSELYLAAWNVLSLFFTWGLSQLKLELEKYIIATKELKGKFYKSRFMAFCYVLY
jgi:hypothetical protein